MRGSVSMRGGRIRLRRGSETSRDSLMACAALKGFQGAYLLVDRATGKALTMTLWSSEETADASAERAKQMRSDAAGGAGMSIESVETYEVAVNIQPGG